MGRGTKLEPVLSPSRLGAGEAAGNRAYLSGTTVPVTTRDGCYGADWGPGGWKLGGFELVRARVPLKAPWVSGAGAFSDRDTFLVRAVLRKRGQAGGWEEVEGWGECPALPAPTYSSEYTSAAIDVSVRHLAPLLLGAGVSSAGAVGPALAQCKGHRMAKTAFEAAVLDAELRASGGSMADFFCRLSETRVPARTSVLGGVAVGLARSRQALLDEVERFVAEGYRRVKLKITAGGGLRPERVVAAVRDRWPDLVLFVDANGSYEGLGPQEAAAQLSVLDRYGLACIEQPLGEDDLAGHARLAKALQTPICLDEALTSYGAVVTALEMGACSVVNVKAGRFGGYLEAVRVHDLCARRGVPVWCGGMVETGIARAANVALAGLVNFSLPGDLSASGRFFETDLTSALTLRTDGTIAVPSGPGSGVTVDQGAIDHFAIWRRWYPAS